MVEGRGENAVVVSISLISRSVFAFAVCVMGTFFIHFPLPLKEEMGGESFPRGNHGDLAEFLLNEERVIF